LGKLKNGAQKTAAGGLKGRVICISENCTALKKVPNSPCRVIAKNLISKRSEGVG